MKKRNLFPALLSLALAILAIVRAPTYRLWMAAVGVTEWGHLLALAALAQLLPFWRRRVGPGAEGPALLAALLSLTPLMRAIPVARKVPGQLVDAFGTTPPRSTEGAPARPAPLVGADLIRGVWSPRSTPQTLVYAEHGERKLLIDIYPPRTAHKPAPGVLVIHGGAWEHGDRTQLSALNHYLAARGYLVAAINYRLSPEFAFPAALEDVQAAIRFLKTQSERIGLDPTRLALLGRSAGGQLALLAAYTANDPAIKGVIGFYAPIDLRWGYQNPSPRLVIDTCGVLERYLGGSPEETGDAYDRAAPLHFVGPHTPATLLLHGKRDELVSPVHSRRLAARLEAANRPYALIELPWATHGFDANLAGPGGQISTFAIERFLAAVL